tara:strand:+ start:28 stop:240 length:213 start_codon:yes stop_codon:yes gene_type:complete
MEKYMSTDNHNKINDNKDLYDRVIGWMADMDDPSNLTDDEMFVSKEDFDEYMLDEAMQIMYDIYQTCEEN